MSAASLGDALDHLAGGDWQRAHAIVQADESPLGCWAHGVVHVLEGDLDNARYWYGRARRAWPDRYDVQAELTALRAAHDARERARGER
jgi:hypothetical protein